MGCATHPGARRFWLAAAAAGALAVFAAVPSRAQAASAAPHIVTSFYPVYLATLNVTRGVPGVKVENLTQPLTGCLHDYQLTTEDLRKLARADVFVANGLGMESFLDKVVKQFPQLAVIDASKGIAPLREAATQEINPHVWVSVSLHSRQVSNIATQLGLADPARARAYAANATAYGNKLEDLRRTMHQGLRTVRTRDIVTFHEAFPYFAKEFGLHVAAVIEREPGSQPSARELAATVELVKRTGVRALFAEPQYAAKAAQTIARETGAQLYVLDPAVTGPDDPEAYVKIMAANLAELQRALR